MPVIEKSNEGFVVSVGRGCLYYCESLKCASLVRAAIKSASFQIDYHLSGVDRGADFSIRRHLAFGW